MKTLLNTLFRLLRINLYSKKDKEQMANDAVEALRYDAELEKRYELDHLREEK